MSIYPGINLEFIRCKDKPFAEGVRQAAQMGYRWVEPLVHNGRELLSEAGYYHSVSMDDDPHFIKDVLDEYGVKASGLSAHTPLMRPEIAVPYLEKAIRYAATLRAPVVNTDEGIRPPWVSSEEAWCVMKYTLTTVLRVAERYGVAIGIEPHQSISKTTAGLLRLATLVDHPLLRVNYDTGNAFLAGEDPYQGLRAVLDRVVHVHAKDIGGVIMDDRGKVTGVPSGVACGEGIIDWPRVVKILRKAGFKGVFSVECGTEAQAASSIKFLRKVLG